MAGKMNVKLFLDLVNRLSAPAKAAKADLKGVGQAARDLKKERGGDQIAKDLDRTRASAARTARELRAMKAAMQDLARTAATINLAPALGKGGALASGGGMMKGAMVGGALGAGRRAIAPVAAGLGGYAAVRGTVGQSVSFEKSMADVKKKVDLPDGENFEKLERQITSMAIAMGKSREDVASIVAEAGAAGVAYKDLAGFTQLATKASIAWDVPAKEAAQKLFEIRAATGKTLAELEEFGDKVNKLGDTSAAKESAILEMANRAMAAARESGVNENTSLAFLTAMRSVGIQEEVSARGFGVLVSKMATADESKKVGEGLKMLGLDAKKMAKSMKTDATTALMGLFAALEKSKDPTKAAVKIFGQEWFDEMLRAKGAIPEIKKALNTLSSPENYKGSMTTTLNIELETTANHLEKLKALSSDVGDRLGRWALPPINAAIEQLIKLMNEFDAKTADKKGVEDTAQRLADDQQLTPAERKRMAEDKEYRQAVEVAAKKRREEAADQKEGELRGALKRGVSQDDGEHVQGQRRRQLERLKLDRDISDREKNLKLRDPTGRDGGLLGERRMLESLRKKRQELGAAETPTTSSLNRSDKDEAASRTAFSQRHRQDQEIEGLRKKIAAFKELAAAASNMRDMTNFLQDTVPLQRKMDRTIAPNTEEANRFRLKGNGAGTENEATLIARGVGKFGLGGPATAGGGSIKGATATPEEVAAKWKNTAKATAEDLKAAFNIDLGPAAMTMMERLAAGITGSTAKVDGAAEGVGNSVKGKLSAVDLNSAGQQMMQGLAAGITSGGAQAVAAAQAVAGQVKAAMGGAGGFRTASVRSRSSGALHDGVA